MQGFGGWATLWAEAGAWLGFERQSPRPSHRGNMVAPCSQDAAGYPAAMLTRSSG